MLAATDDNGLGSRSGDPDLAEFLASWAGADARHVAARDAIAAIAKVCIAIDRRIASGALIADHGAVVGASLDNDGQKALDQWADIEMIAALQHAGVSAVVTEERPEIISFEKNGGVVVAIDPIDGSSNIAINGAIGTIFSIFPDIGADSFRQAGTAQIAAGYVLFGAQCALALTLGNGTQMFVLNPDEHRFKLTEIDMQIPPCTNEVAINGSNYRYWSTRIRGYIDDCIAGRDGPRNADINTRWVAAVVADAHRILHRGGVYLYPGDARPGYAKGRLRLLYEAHPLAFLIEQAGGKAFDGRTRILDLVPADIHQRVPLIFGSADEVDRIARYKSDPDYVVQRAPLFHRRGLFKGF